MATALTILALLASPLPPADCVLGEGIERQVTFVCDLACESASGTGDVKDVEFRAALPVTDGRQSVGPMDFDPAPDAFQRDRDGNRLAVWRRPLLRAGEIVTLSWTAEVLVRAIEHRPDRAKLRPLAETPPAVKERFLGGGPKYALGDPKVIEASREAAAGATDALDLAFRLNEYLRARLTYKNDGRWDAAPQVLTQGHGSCSEYNFLFMSLCRLNGLAARYAGATALRSDEPLYDDDVFHRWTEVWLPGHGWFPVDVSRNDGEDGQPVNLAFGRTSERLLVTMKGDGSDDAPLGWGYIAGVDKHETGDARLSVNDRFRWAARPAPASTEAAGGR